MPRSNRRRSAPAPSPKKSPGTSRKTKRITPYLMMLSSMGVVAFGVAIFSITSHIRTNDITTPQLQSSSPSSSYSQPEKDKNKTENSSSSSSSSSQEDVLDALPASGVKVLTGETLDKLLLERTGVSELSGKGSPLPVSTAIKNSSSMPNVENMVKPGNDSSSSSKASDSSSSSSSDASSDASSKEDTPKSTTPAKFTPTTVGATGAANIPQWKSQNSDVIGWLRIPNTNIDYPVVVGPDNLYYNELGYKKEPSKNGVIWADSYTKFGKRSEISQNTVLYGHNWTNFTASPVLNRSTDVMFGQLPSYHYLDFAKNTPYIHYSTDKEEMTWKVFAAFYTEDTLNYIESDAGSSYIQTLADEAKKRSLHNFDVDVNGSDKLLTLSTCTRAYGQRADQRFVVMARLMRSGETVSEVTVTANPNFKKPQF